VKEINVYFITKRIRIIKLNAWGILYKISAVKGKSFIAR